MMTSLVALALSALACCAVHADWPDRPVSLIVPWPAGGATDAMARIVAPSLSAEFKQPVIVVNRAGATGNLGAESVLQQPADGYQILFTATSHLINSALHAHNGKPLRYDPVSDFRYAAVVTDSSMVLVVHPAVAANTLGEFVTLAKYRPGKLSYASSGNGSIQHLSAESLQKATGIQLLHVPYKGIAPAMNDLMAGVVDASVESLTGVLPLIKAGRLKPLAVLTTAPIAALPGVPTAMTQGYPGLFVSGPQFAGVPQATPDDVVARIGTAFGKVFNNAEIVKRLDAAGVTVLYAPEKEANRIASAERAKWSRIIKEADVKLD